MTRRSYIIVFSTLDHSAAKILSFVENDTKARHYTRGGFPVTKETASCWYLEEYPAGLPERYRKSDEYRLRNNKNGIYMFGRKTDELIKSWNSAVMA